jgi:cyanophycinase
MSVRAPEVWAPHYACMYNLHDVLIRKLTNNLEAHAFVGYLPQKQRKTTYKGVQHVRILGTTKTICCFRKVTPVLSIKNTEMEVEELKKYQHENDCPTPSGKLMIIGGGKDRETILKDYVDLIEVENPVIELITTAGSVDVEDTYKEYKQIFEKHIACTVNHIHHDRREDIDAEEAESRVKAADAVFIAGGDQLKLTSIYGGTGFLFLLKHRYIYEGLLIGGTSAGAMVLSTPMIFAGTGADEMIAGKVKITTGFEFLRDICIDTHFVARGRVTRLAQVVATNLSTVGWGIEEDTAVIVENGTDARVAGAGVVLILDGKESFGNNVTKFDDNQAISIRNLKVSILPKGEKFDIHQMNPPHK